MKRPENDKWLDEALSETIGSKKPRTDFKQWKQKYPKAVEMLTSRADKQASASPSPLMIRRKIMKNQIAKLAAMVALICMGVAAATVVGIKYHYVEQDEKGRHHVRSEDGTTGFLFDDGYVDGPEKAVAYAEELTLLKQQGDRELVGVTEIEVNGQHDSRSLAYEYNLSDGQTRRVIESDTDDTGPRTLVGERLDEALQLFREIISTDIARAETDGQSVKIIYLTADGQEIETYEKVVHGRLFSFKTRRFTLSDGTEVAWSIGDLKENQ